MHRQTDTHTHRHFHSRRREHTLYYCQFVTCVPHVCYFIQASKPTASSATDTRTYGRQLDPVAHANVTYTASKRNVSLYRLWPNCRAHAFRTGQCGIFSCREFNANHIMIHHRILFPLHSRIFAYKKCRTDAITIPSQCLAFVSVWMQIPCDAGRTRRALSNEQNIYM